MPTATTSQLMGNNECIEPYTSNIYKRSTLSGEYVVVKKTLMHDLHNLQIWNNNLKDYLLNNLGSIQHIDGIPDIIKKLYKTSWEIDQSELIQQSIDRQPFIDQGQSLNLYSDNITIGKWNKWMFQAWKGGLKTGKYYLHTKAAVMPVMFTIDPKKQKEILLNNQIKSNHVVTTLKNYCDSCSG
jgi:ribonucleoside-diphosphate reductase alpha chain